LYFQAHCDSVLAVLEGLPELDHHLEILLGQTVGAFLLQALVCSVQVLLQDACGVLSHYDLQASVIHVGVQILAFGVSTAIVVKVVGSCGSRYHVVAVEHAEIVAL